LSWDVTGNVRIRFTRTAGNNALVEGIFFDVAPKSTRNVGFKLKSAGAQGAQLEVTGDPGTYTIQSSTDMTTWNDLGEVTLEGSTATFTDTNVNGNGLRIYRAKP
jgi:hypothetical protein